VVSWDQCTIVIPAYNEAERIDRILNDLDDFEGRLVFVCDGNDATAEKIRDFAGRHPGLSVLCMEFGHRLGKGGGVLEGMKAADTPFVGFMDADGSTSLQEMKKLFVRLDTEDGAIGSRWLEGSEIVIAQGWWRRLQSRMFNMLVQMLFGLRYRDTQCGAKVFRRDALEKVLPSMVSRGFEFDVELLWRLRKAGCRIEEVPIRWINRGESRVAGADGLGMLVALVRLRYTTPGEAG
jgi:dolichol-phosphate mannosyltransferase